MKDIFNHIRPFYMSENHMGNIVHILSLALYTNSPRYAVLDAGLTMTYSVINNEFKEYLNSVVKAKNDYEYV